MTVAEAKVIEDMEKKIERMRLELKELRKVQSDGFEPLDTDLFLTEVYN